MVSRSSLFLSVSLMVMLTPSIGAAKPDRMKEAKVAFDKATLYFEAEEYKSALPWFEKAYELSNKRPSTIFGLAQCLRTLGRYEDAIVKFEEYLATNPEDASQVRETVGLLKEIVAEKDQARKQAKEEADRNAREEEERRAAAARAKEAAEQPPPPPTESNSTTVESTPEPESSGGSVFTSPVFWIIVGAVVIGGGVATGVAVASSGSPEYYGGSSGVILEP